MHNDCGHVSHHLKHPYGYWLTLGPFGPSLTAQTADPCTKQCEHLHVVLSLQILRLAKIMLEKRLRKNLPFI